MRAPRNSNFSGLDLAALERAMALARERLEVEGFPYRQPSIFQLKIGEVNYYPSTGTITLDGHVGSDVGKGLDKLIILLRKRRSR